MRHLRAMWEDAVTHVSVYREDYTIGAVIVTWGLVVVALLKYIFS